MTDKKAERERLQAEALKANLRRRKSQARAQKESAREAASVNADTPENPQQSSDGAANP